jgi:hypothetical protein
VHRACSEGLARRDPPEPYGSSCEVFGDQRFACKLLPSSLAANLRAFLHGTLCDFAYEFYQLCNAPLKKFIDDRQQLF